MKSDHKFSLRPGTMLLVVLLLAAAAVGTWAWRLFRSQWVARELTRRIEACNVASLRKFPAYFPPPVGWIVGDSYLVVNVLYLYKGFTLDSKTADQIAELHHLSGLWLEGCKVDPGALRRIGPSSSIIKAKFVDVDMDQAELDVLQGWKSLFELTLTGFQEELSASTFSALNRIPMLRTLVVERCKFADANFALLHNNQLTELCLIDVDLSQQALDHLDQLPSLTFFNGYKSRFAGKSGRSLWRLPKLTGLCLTETQFDPDLFRNLPAGLKIERLYLEKTAIDDSCVREIVTLPELYYLSLSRCPITEDGVLACCQGKSITHLELEELPVSDETLEQLCAALPILREVFLFGTQVTPAKAADLKAKYPELKLLLERDDVTGVLPWL